MMGFGWGLMWLWPIGLVVIGIIVYYAVTESSRKDRYSHQTHYQQPQHHGNRALEILKERYAKGEITKEQFHQMKKELE
jgi:putative membrane protein